VVAHSGNAKDEAPIQQNDLFIQDEEMGYNFQDCGGARFQNHEGNQSIKKAEMLTFNNNPIRRAGKGVFNIILLDMMVVSNMGNSFQEDHFVVIINPGCKIKKKHTHEGSKTLMIKEA
jgi:hypothetical protein